MVGQSDDEEGFRQKPFATAGEGPRTTSCQLTGF